MQSINHRHTVRAAGVLLAIGVITTSNNSAIAQNILVNTGETLTESDLNAGSFMGQIFTLGPSTTFDINDGGEVGPLGEVTNLGNVAGPFEGRTFDLGGSTLNIHNGGGISTSDTPLDRYSYIANADINVMPGGYAGGILFVSSDTTIDFSGGSVGIFGAELNSVVNVSGGTFYDTFIATAGSTINVSGGDFLLDFITNGATVNLSGGNFPSIVSTGPVNIYGSEFALDGIPVTHPTVNIPEGSVLTGTYPDGSVMIMNAFAGNFMSDSHFFVGSANLINSPPPGPPQTVFDVPIDVAPKGLRPGHTLNLGEGGTIPQYFNAAGATMNISGGTVGGGLGISQTDVNVTGGHIIGLDAYSGSIVSISSGTIGGFDARPGSVTNVSGGQVNSIRVFPGSSVNISDGTVTTITAGDPNNNDSSAEVNITGGHIGNHFHIRGGTVNISGGLIGDHMVVDTDSVANITGGDIGDNFSTYNSEVNISGGRFGDRFDSDQSDINLFGRAFFLNGIEISDLIIGEAVGIVDRGVTLSGILADGSDFSFDLNPFPVVDGDRFQSTGLTVTLVPEPWSILMLIVGSLAFLYSRVEI